MILYGCHVRASTEVYISMTACSYFGLAPEELTVAHVKSLGGDRALPPSDPPGAAFANPVPPKVPRDSAGLFGCV